MDENAQSPLNFEQDAGELVHVAYALIDMAMGASNGMQAVEAEFAKFGGLPNL